jgi:LEA14-like dessication related protein
MLRAAPPLLLSLALLPACTPPSPPTLTAKSVSVSSISPSGVSLDVEISATNPNSVALSADSATAAVLIDSSTPLGNATMPSHISLPASSTTTVHMPLAVTWDNLANFIGVAATGRDVPYTVEGSATIGGGGLHAVVPFTIHGTFTHAQILSVTQSSLQGLPGLPQLLGAPKTK